MLGFNTYFWVVWLSMLEGLWWILGASRNNELALNWWIILIVWFLVGPIGTGVGFHKLFSHRQFKTWKPVEYTLAVLGTFSFYAPVLFWTAIHQKHHKVADTAEDPSSPIHYGFWESFFTYRMRVEALQKTTVQNYCVRRIVTDKFLMFLSRRFIFIYVMWAILLSFCGVWWVAHLLIIPCLLEALRVNIVSSLSHMRIPGSYRNYETPDQSWNHVVLGLLTFGFGWHNNHHQFPREVVNSHRWWELDIEGLIANLLTKST